MQLSGINVGQLNYNEWGYVKRKVLYMHIQDLREVVNGLNVFCLDETRKLKIFTQATLRNLNY